MPFRIERNGSSSSVRFSMNRPPTGLAHGVLYTRMQRLWPSPPPGPDAAFFLSSRRLGFARVRVDEVLLLRSTAGGRGSVSAAGLWTTAAPADAGQWRRERADVRRKGACRAAVPRRDATAVRFAGAGLRVELHARRFHPQRRCVDDQSHRDGARAVSPELLAWTRWLPRDHRAAMSRALPLSAMRCGMRCG